MFRHSALLYRGVDELVTSLVPFLEEGVRRGEPAFVAVGPAEVEALRDRIGTAPDVRLADTNAWHPHPASRLRAFHELVTGELHAGVEAIRLVGEPVPDGPAEFVREWVRYESVLNTALEPFPVALVCPYDVTRIDPEIVEHAGRTHPILRRGTDDLPSEAFVDPAVLLGQQNPPLVAPPVDAAQLPRASDLRTARRFVRGHAGEAGVPPTLVDDLVVATTEVLTNALVHGGGDPVLRAWRTPGGFVCQVEDEGPGVADVLAGYHPPPTAGRYGRGLWLARQLVDLLQIVTGPGGTTARLHVREREALPVGATPTRT